ncbi:hypothetical protein KAT08_01725 [Candidatus Babeliales bacterium]|nr:hypothetical protein [Candidatus Babeliales bacterium]
MKGFAINSIYKFGITILVISLFVGCKPLSDFFKKGKKEKVEDIVKKGEPKGVVLLKVNGEVANESDFNEYLNQMLQMNPYFRGATAESLPAPLKENFFNEYKKRIEILAYQKKQKVYEESDFIADYKKMCGLVKDSLLIQRFEKNVYDKISVDDSEIKKYFENNKKDKFKKEDESVSILAIKYKDSKIADEFYDSVKGKGKEEFEKISNKEKDGEFKDFGRVAKEQKGMEVNNVPKSVKDKAFKLRRFPSIEKIKVGKNVWVACFSDKRDVEYFELDEIKPQIEAMLRRNKVRDELMKQIEIIEKELNIYVNEGYFKEKKQMLPPGVKIKTKEEVEAEKKGKKESSAVSI